jgi:hypothetical protein
MTGAARNLARRTGMALDVPATLAAEAHLHRLSGNSDAALKRLREAADVAARQKAPAVERRLREALAGFTPADPSRPEIARLAERTP